MRLAVIAYDGESNPSTRLRILQYIPSLARAGFDVSTTFVSQRPEAHFDVGASRAAIDRADIVFVQRVLRRPLLRLLSAAGKPIVFDFDDALHYIRQSQYPLAHSPRGARDALRNGYRRVLRGSRYYSGRKRLLDSMLSLSARVLVGNEWLADDLRIPLHKVVVVPTSVWVHDAPCREHHEHVPVRLGWIGVPSNLYHLDALRPVFVELDRRFGAKIELAIVSSKTIDVPISTRFIPWSLSSESAEVMLFDIGLMPLQDDPFSRGKCAFKAIHCMQHGVPVVASPVGANTTLIVSGQNGWLADSPDEWVARIGSLVANSHARAVMGRAARRTIEERYSAEEASRLLDRVLRDAMRR